MVVDMTGSTVGGTAGQLVGNTVGGMAGDMGDMEDTWVVVGTFPGYTCQSSAAAASLDNWAGIWPHTFVHIWDHSSWDQGAYFYHHSTFFLGYGGLRRNERQSVSEGQVMDFFLLDHAVLMCLSSRTSKQAVLACGLGVCLGVCTHFDFLSSCFCSRL